MPEQEPAPAVCIAGMHRSGTSMVAHVLAEAGLDVGPESDFLPADAANADGYWENRRFLALDDAVLGALGGGWDAPPVAPRGWEDHDALEPLARDARALVHDLALAEPWGWKNPRTSLTFPFWRRIVPGLHVVVCVRNPVEVALSLQRRGATSPALALELWREYNQRIITATAAGERVVTLHDDYFADPRGEVARLLAALGMSVDPDRIDAGVAVPKSSLRHHAVGLSEMREAGVPAPIAELYEALVEEARSGQPVELRAPASHPRRGTDAEPTRLALVQAIALRQERDRFRIEAQELRAELARVAAEAEAERAAIREQLERVRSEAADRNRWRKEAERAQTALVTWQEEAQRLAVDRDAWHTEAERFERAAARRLSTRLSHAAFRRARRLWWSLPAAVRDQLRPILLRRSRGRAVGAASAASAAQERSTANEPGEGETRAPPRSALARSPQFPRISETVSVVIPTLNAGEELTRVLAALCRQEGIGGLDVLVVDSGSVDGTPERARREGTRVLEISPGEFRHGPTRDWAIAQTAGDLVLMTVQDAMPLGQHALRDLALELRASPRAAAISARQVPRSDADLYAAFVVWVHDRTMRESRATHGRRPRTPIEVRAMAALDDVCALLRRDVWENVRYGDVRFAEDLDFGLRAVAAGHEVLLSESVAFAHSHNRTAAYHFRRTVADRVCLAPLVGDDDVCASARRGLDVVLPAASILLEEVETVASQAESRDSTPLDRRLAKAAQRLSEGPTRTSPRGELAEVTGLLLASGNETRADWALSALRFELLSLLRRSPLVQEFIAANRAVNGAEAAGFVRKMAAGVVGRAVGDAVRCEGTTKAAERFLKGV
jgi:GT2 family glycosyltransferase